MVLPSALWWSWFRGLLAATRCGSGWRERRSKPHPGRAERLALDELLAENERLQHIIDCANTPLMVDVLRARDEALAENQRLRQLVDHQGLDVTNKRIRVAHSQMAAEWLAGDEDVHRAYKQDHNERCYICALLARCARLEAALREIAAEKHTWSEGDFEEAQHIAR